MSWDQNIGDELLVNYLLGEASADEIVAVEQWLTASAENKKYFLQFKSIWEYSDTLASTTQIDTDKSWIKLKRKLKPKNNIFKVNTRVLAAAASLTLLITTVWFFTRPKSNQDAPRTEVISLQNDKDTIAQNNYDSLQPIKEEKKIVIAQQKTLIDTLEDKSVITLNKNAQLSTPKQFAELERRVQLKGEAFFNITPNKKKPFIIETQNKVEITVVGTSFNVKSRPNYTEIIVETGKVQVKYKDQVVLINPSELAKIDSKDSTIVIKKVDSKLYKYYRTKVFECDETPLYKVVEVLNQAYGDSIVIQNNDLRNLKLTTSFNNESLASILEILSETFDIEVTKKGNKYLLK